MTVSGAEQLRLAAALDGAHWHRAAATVAPLTSRIGLIPPVTVTHTEPFHISTAIVTLDWVNSARGGAAVSDLLAEERSRR